MGGKSHKLLTDIFINAKSSLCFLLGDNFVCLFEIRPDYTARLASNS